MQNIEHRARLLRVIPLGTTSCRLDFAAPTAAGLFAPGQFLELQTSALLKRPFAVMAQDKEKGEISVGVKIVGEQSLWLSQLKAGTVLALLGPLGHGFRLNGVRQLIAVGGGSGIFALCEAARCVTAQGGEALMICGFRSPEEAYDVKELSDGSFEVFRSSDCGGLDFSGHAAAALLSRKEEIRIAPDTLLIACGPKPLLQACRDIAQEAGISCQLSLEERMACGLGLCLGCAVDVKGERPGEIRRVRCCVEGPVFQADELVL